MAGGMQGSFGQPNEFSGEGWRKSQKKKNVNRLRFMTVMHT
jgi:hypothetical protein